VRKLAAAIVYYILSVLLFPVTLVGYLIWVASTFLVRGTSCVSVTAQGPLFARWLAHNLGTRRDELANRLLRGVPGVPHLGLFLAAGPMLLAHRMSGYVPKALRYPFEGEILKQDEVSARQAFFDNVVDHFLTDIGQLVILGAGFDTRAFNLPEGTRVRSFEVDAPATQAIKRAVLEKTGIDSTGVTFVAADFQKDDWLMRLVDAGFDPDEATLFLWEGVMMYLDKEGVEATLHKVARTAKGSVIAFDYFTTEALESGALYWRYVRAMTWAAGESLEFGIDSTPPSSERLDELLRSCGLSLDKHRTLGDETDVARAWGGFATAIVK
jgi:methyltransferase (TIGR00027 family)